ncbi:MAG: MarR family transcriptional regulator [Rectinemataceae bacterium]|nr:MarR family transcriptional regulator [Rectinemataceae bacterium]
MQRRTVERRQAVVIWSRLALIYKRLDALGEKNFRAMGLNTAWFDVLARVGAHEGITQGELAAALSVTKGCVSQLLAKMEASGLVTRKVDGHSRQVWLTAKGQTLAEELLPSQEARLQDSLGALSSGEQIALKRLLRKWEKTIKERLS